MKTKTLEFYESSTTGNYLVTLAIGSNYLERWEKLSLPLWRIYCVRHGIGLAAMVNPYHDPGNKRLDWQKLLVGKALNDNNVGASSVGFIDYDMVPNPYSENIFAAKKPKSIAIVSQRTSLPYGEVGALIKRIIYFRNTVSNGRYPLNSYILREPSDVFRDHELSPKDNLACGGLFIFDNLIHSAFLEEVFFKYDKYSKLVANDGEMVYLNWHIQNRDDYEWLGYEWQTLWWYEMAAYYPWLYSVHKRRTQNVSDAILSSLVRAKFLHFVGSWEKWAWPYIDVLTSGDGLSVLQSLKEIDRMKLDSPSLGQIFPASVSELNLISK